MNVVALSDQLKSEADEVIKSAKMISFFEKVGQVVFVGSYKLNLLLRLDIDLFVRSKKCSLDIALNITKQLLDSELFQTVGFANCTDYQCPNGLPGYYWELIYENKGKKWKFDVWYTAEKNIRAILKTEVIRKKLEERPEARKEILELKNKLFDGDEYIDGMNGYKIYESVLGKI